MSKIITLLFATLFLQSCLSSEDDVVKIKRCFADYKTAIQTCQGQLGLECVDSRTINYYSQTLRKVIEFDSLQIKREAPIDKYTILKIRQNIPADSIIHLKGESLLASLINHCMAGNSNISLYEIGNIKIDNDTATVEKIISGKPTEFVFKFYKENNNWKLSTFSPRERGFYNWGIRQSILKSKLSEDEFILRFIETSSNKKLKENIWHPLYKK